MIKRSLVPLLFLSAVLSTPTAYAFPALDGATAAASSGPQATKVLKHCKSKQSRCHAFRKNF